MAINHRYTTLRKPVNRKNFTETWEERKNQSREERKRLCAYCGRKWFLPKTRRSATTWHCIDRTHGFFCKESCAALWALEYLTEKQENDNGENYDRF